LLEANGVLHPRGSEYGVQYVVDGIPIFDNRSPLSRRLWIGRAAVDERADGELSGEFGRKLGGVIDVVTARAFESRFHGKAAAPGWQLFDAERVCLRPVRFWPDHG